MGAIRNRKSKFDYLLAVWCNVAHCKAKPGEQCKTKEGKILQAKYSHANRGNRISADIANRARWREEA